MVDWCYGNIICQLWFLRTAHILDNGKQQQHKITMLPAPLVMLMGRYRETSSTWKYANCCSHKIIIMLGKHNTFSCQCNLVTVLKKYLSLLSPLSLTIHNILWPYLNSEDKFHDCFAIYVKFSKWWYSCIKARKISDSTFISNYVCSKMHVLPLCSLSLWALLQICTIYMHAITSWGNTLLMNFFPLVLCHYDLCV